ncbi:MAG: hypothetical protein ABR886_09985 [Dehalococcoidales bacterium]|jgi:hypothetical protein
MTRARFKTEVKIFALKEREQGKSWSIIRHNIKERFKVEPPTVRAMEKWKKSLNPENIAAEFFKDAKQEIPKFKKEVQIEMGQNLLPLISQAREVGEDMEAATWKWFFQWAESYIGKEKFKKLVTDYLSQQGDVSSEEVK